MKKDVQNVDNTKENINDKKTENIEKSEDTKNMETKEEGGRYLSGFITGVFVSVAFALVVFIVCIVINVALKGKIPFFKYSDSSQVGTVKVEENSEITDSMDEITSKIEYLANFISTYYIDDVDSKQIEEGIYKGIFENIGDKYAQYYTANEYKELNEKTTGEFGGIGVKVIQDEKKGIVVKEDIKDGGAQKAGIKEGDIIIGVEDTDVTSMELDDVIDLIKGEVDTKVKIKIKRADKDSDAYKEMEFNVTRSIVETVNVYSKMLDDKIGYIYISSYMGKSGEQFKQQLNDLKSQGMKGLIIDERDNGGGLLSVAKEIADCLMDEGVLVTTKNKEGEVTQSIETTDDGTILNVPMVLLVNENSASASEVVAGAIKDRNIGKIVGTKTFGKGIVQSIIPLKDGSAIKITTERYYTPNGNYIHEKGIEPDVEVKLDEDKAKDGIDSQLEKAKEVLKSEY